MTEGTIKRDFSERRMICKKGFIWGLLSATIFWGWLKNNMIIYCFSSVAGDKMKLKLLIMPGAGFTHSLLTFTCSVGICLFWGVQIYQIQIHWHCVNHIFWVEINTQPSRLAQEHLQQLWVREASLYACFWYIVQTALHFIQSCCTFF